MALTDIYTTPSISQSFSTAGLTAGLIFGSSIDLTNSGIDVGAGTDIYATINVTTNVTGTGASVAFAFVTATDAALTAGVVVLATTPTVARTALNAGYQFPIMQLPQGTVYKRYCGWLQVITGAAITAGKATCAISLAPQNWRAYDDNVN